MSLLRAVFKKPATATPLAALSAPLLLLVTACTDPKELTRAKAMSLLAAAHTNAVTLDYDGIGVLQCLHNMGFAQAAFPLPSAHGMCAKGDGDVVEACDTSNIIGQSHISVTLAKQLPIAVQEVTGISNPPTDTSGDTKSVDFVGVLDFSPVQSSPGIGTCMSPGSKPFPAVAVFKRYDDGWRLQSFTIPMWHVPELKDFTPR